MEEIYEAGLPKSHITLAADLAWPAYEMAIMGLRDAHIPFLIGGAFALSAYTGMRRDTKNLDLFILHSDLPRAVRSLEAAEYIEYFETSPYDRRWIYRSTRGGVIVNLIWAMANRRAEVDAICFQHANSIQVGTTTADILPAEELLWWKLYVLQRERCDWPDIFNLIHAVGANIDWGRLIKRVGEDLPMLRGVLSIYAWLCPEQALELPLRLYNQLGIKRSRLTAQKDKINRASLLDNRPWLSVG